MNLGCFFFFFYCSLTNSLITFPLLCNAPICVWIYLFIYLFICAVASWFLSPLLSGIMSAVVFYFVRRFILQKVSLLLSKLWICSVNVTLEEWSCGLRLFQHCTGPPPKCNWENVYYMAGNKLPCFEAVPYRNTWFRFPLCLLCLEM